MRTVLVMSLAVWALVALGACGEEGLALEDAPAAYVDAYCARVTECTGTVLYKSPDACRAWLLPLLEDDDFARIRRAVSSKTITYYGTKMQETIDRYATASCAELMPLMDARVQMPYGDALAGLVAKGGRCTVDSECSGSPGTVFCNTQNCPGTCTAATPLDGDCSTDRECETGLVCFETAPQSYKCGTPVGPGAPCRGPAYAPGCEVGYECWGATKVAAGVCKTIVEELSGEEGDLCTDQSGCAPGLSCAMSTTPFQCVPLASAGQPCRSGFPDPCPDGHYCALAPASFEGTCKPLPAEGEDCSGSYECAAGMDCGEDYLCVPLQRIGAACSTDFSCYSYNCDAGLCGQPRGCW